MSDIDIQRSDYDSDHSYRDLQSLSSGDIDRVSANATSTAYTCLTRAGAESLVLLRTESTLVRKQSWCRAGAVSMIQLLPPKGLFPSQITAPLGVAL